MADRMLDREVTLAKRDNPLYGDDRRVVLPRMHLHVERQAGVAVDIEYVHDGDVCRIGSHESNDVVLADRTISRFHCRITRHRDGWRIVDTGSRNGTRLDGVRVLAAELDGDHVVTLGDSTLRLRPASRGDGIAVPVIQSFGTLVGKSVAMQQLFAVLQRVAPSQIDVLVAGESGTGKELVAKEIVKHSPRAAKPFVVVDCSSISPALVESELFGHARGSFTGAERDREGAFEAADGGTVFLDEVGELPTEMQPKLLRALEAREIRRVGETRARRVDVRVIAATNRDLEVEVNAGRFREDLYYRLAKVSVRVPPLRDRSEDIPLLLRQFLAGAAPADVDRLFSQSVVADLQQHDWPGNVRELKNYVERRIVLEDAPAPSKKSGTMKRVAPEAEPADDGPPPSGDGWATRLPFRAAKEAVVEAFERQYIGPLLEHCKGNMSKAARLARMDRTYLNQLAQKYGFRRR